MANIDFNQLARPQLAILRQSLVAAYQREEFNTLLVSKGFGQLGNYTRSSSFQNQIVELIENFTRKGIMNNLLGHILEHKAVAPSVRDLAQKLALTRPDPALARSIDLEQLVLDAGFSDLNQWAGSLVKLATRVCRLAYLLDGERASGTGFLVGRDLVLTSYSVIEPLIQMKIGLAGVKCHIGFTEAPVQVEEFSLIDAKRNFALIRISTKAGDDKRGWIDLPSDTPHLKSGEIVFILQSPHGKPVTMSTGLVRESQSPSRIRYDAVTEKGASGALVIGLGLEPIGLHLSTDAIALSEVKIWLGDRDSNPDKQSQSLLSYR